MQKKNSSIANINDNRPIEISNSIEPFPRLKRFTDKLKKQTVAVATQSQTPILETKPRKLDKPVCWAGSRKILTMVKPELPKITTETE